MTSEEIQHEDDLLITADVARAVEERELIAYYQPVVSLTMRKVVGAEALVRWTMPDGTIVPAGLFVPSLDRTDTIIGLDWFMAEDTAGFLAKVAGTPAYVPISLNFSARHAQTPGFADTLLATIGWHDVARDLVRVEMGESLALANNPEVDALVDTVCAAGIEVVIDKYTRGSEGLDAIVARNVHRIKVARDYWPSKDVAALTEFVNAAKDRGVIISAEGVESQEEAEHLAAAGFEYAQGFYLGEPMDGESFMRICEAA